MLLSSSNKVPVSILQEIIYISPVFSWPFYMTNKGIMPKNYTYNNYYSVYNYSVLIVIYHLAIITIFFTN